MISPNPNETYDEWIERSRQYELDIARKQIGQGRDPEEVINIMSNRLTEKLLYPLHHFIEEEYQSTYNPETSLAEYKEYFKLKNIKPKSDHIVD